MWKRKPKRWIERFTVVVREDANKTFDTVFWQEYRKELIRITREEAAYGVALFGGENLLGSGLRRTAHDCNGAQDAAQKRDQHQQ